MLSERRDDDDQLHPHRVVRSSDGDKNPAAGVGGWWGHTSSHSAPAVRSATRVSDTPMRVERDAVAAMNFEAPCERR